MTFAQSASSVARRWPPTWFSRPWHNLAFPLPITHDRILIA